MFFFFVKQKKVLFVIIKAQNLFLIRKLRRDQNYYIALLWLLFQILTNVIVKPAIVVGERIGIPRQHQTLAR